MATVMRFDRCRGRAYATQLRAFEHAHAVHGRVWRCPAGHLHAGRRGLARRLLQALTRGSV